MGTGYITKEKNPSYATILTTYVKKFMYFRKLTGTAEGTRKTIKYVNSVRNLSPHHPVRTRPGP